MPGAFGYPSGYQAVPTQPPVNPQQLGAALASLGGLVALASPAPDWGRIHEVGRPRSRIVTYEDEVQPESILRGSSRRGMSRAASFHSVNEGSHRQPSASTAPPSPAAPRGSTMSPAIRALMDRIEAEENAATQL